MPAITSVATVSCYNTSMVPVTIKGSKFSTGEAIVLTNTTMAITGAVTSVAPTTITGSFPLGGDNGGIYNLTVSNPGNKNRTRVNTFTFNDLSTIPVIYQLSPASVFNNAKLPVTITVVNPGTSPVTKPFSVVSLGKSLFIVK